MEFSKNPLVDFLNKSYNYLLDNIKQFLLILAGIAVIVALALSYGFYRAKMQERAHKSFVEAMTYFDAKIGEQDNFLSDSKSFKSFDEKWAKTAEVFQKAYNDNSSSGLAPIFLAYQSQALLNLGKLDEAINVLQKSLIIMPKKSALYDYYKVKLALMLIDTQDKGSFVNAISDLKAMALEQNKAVHDLVLYRLGEYYWNQKEFSEAKNYWNQLEIRYGKKTKNPSFWAAEAKSKLKLIQ